MKSDDYFPGFNPSLPQKASLSRKYNSRPPKHRRFNPPPKKASTSPRDGLDLRCARLCFNPYITEGIFIDNRAKRSERITTFQSSAIEGVYIANNRRTMQQVQCFNPSPAEGIAIALFDGLCDLVLFQSFDTAEVMNSDIKSAPNLTVPIFNPSLRKA